MVDSNQNNPNRLMVRCGAVLSAFVGKYLKNICMHSTMFKWTCHMVNVFSLCWLPFTFKKYLFLILDLATVYTKLSSCLAD